MKYLIILLSLILMLSGCSSENNVANSNVSDNSSNVQITRTSINNNTNTSVSEPPKQAHEEELASYSTNILNYDQDRQDNVRLASAELNGKVVNSRGKIFF